MRMKNPLNSPVIISEDSLASIDSRHYVFLVCGYDFCLWNKDSIPNRQVEDYTSLNIINRFAYLLSSPIT